MAFQVAFTGHRPEKIGGYNPTDPLRVKVEGALNSLWERIVELHPDAVAIVGGAQGIDTDAARIVHRSGRPFRLYVPCHGQENVWPVRAQEKYRSMMDLAVSIRCVSHGLVFETMKDWDEHCSIPDVGGAYTKACMNDRNKAMVDNANMVIAVWDGTTGGTGNCVGYTKTKLPTLELIHLKVPSCEAVRLTLT